MRTHLKNVYASIASASLVAAIGAYLHVYGELGRETNQNPWEINDKW